MMLGRRMSRFSTWPSPSRRCCSTKLDPSRYYPQWCPYRAHSLTPWLRYGNQSSRGVRSHWICHWTRSPTQRSMWSWRWIHLKRFWTSTYQLRCWVCSIGPTCHGPRRWPCPRSSHCRRWSCNRDRINLFCFRPTTGRRLEVISMSWGTTRRNVKIKITNPGCLSRFNRNRCPGTVPRNFNGAWSRTISLRPLIMCLPTPFVMRLDSSSRW